MMRRLLVAACVAATLLLSTVLVPAHAAPPVMEDVPVWFVFLDSDNTLVDFWNITRSDYCAWAAGGFAGDPPVIDLVPAKFKTTGKGAIVASFDVTRPIELWNLDDPGSPTEPCADTDGQAGPWATGDIHVTATDNDLDVSGTRRNSFGDRGRGTMVDGAGGTWHYSWNFRAACDTDCDLDFALRTEHFVLRQRGK